MKPKTPSGYEARGIRTLFEIRTSQDGKVKLAGVAAVFERFSENLGGFIEQIARGAFDETDMSDVRGLFNHDANVILGRTGSPGTLHLDVTEAGLEYEIDLPDTQLVRDMVVSPIERGDVSQSSFGFIVAPGGATFDEDDEGRFIRTVSKIKRLFDVSPVTFPAYPDTAVATRGLDQWHADVAAAEKEMRERESVSRITTLREQANSIRSLQP